ncbi:MAG: hemolysin family protein [Polyangiaceae bacterium]
MLVELLIILVLILVNGVFAGAEIAILSVRKTRLAELVDERRWGAEAVTWLRNHPERFLATVQVGITLVSTAAAAFGGDRLSHDLAKQLALVPGLAPYADTLSFVLVVVGIAFVGIVLGELVPKSLGLKSAERYALLVGPLLRTLASAARPAVWLLTSCSNLVLRLFRDKTSFTEARLSPDELQELVQEAARSGSLDPKTSEIASRALDFRDLEAVDVMVPRTKMVMIPMSATREELRAAFAEHRYARMPVYNESPDDVVGYLAIRDLLEPALRGAPLSIGDLMRPARFVPESLRAAELLKKMQSERAPMSIVVDENGSISGLVTIEDLIEELVGDILSEHDALPPPPLTEPDGSVVLPGNTPIRDANRLLGIELPEPEGYSTLAGLCIHTAGSIPHPHTVLTMEDGTVLHVVDASPRRVRKVQVHPTAPPAADLGGDEDDDDVRS